MSAQKVNTTAINKHTLCVLILLDLTHVTAKLATSWMDSFVVVIQGSIMLLVFSMSRIIIIIVDIDECENSSICEHICINNDGSFDCKCRGNFSLTLDRRGCLGKT